MNVRKTLVMIALAGTWGCGTETNDSEAAVESSTGIQLALTTLGMDGAEYRLAPASFAIQRDGSADPPTVVDASADQNTMIVPIALPGLYTVSLQSGWQLNRVPASGAMEPVPATLMTSNDISVDVRDLQTTPVTYRFRLGKTQLAIGVAVEQDMYPSSDGDIRALSNGLYEIQFRSGPTYSACCFASIAEARAAYPGLDLTVQ